MTAGKIKCVVWDLDNTLWDGVLLEDERVRLREGVPDIIKALDGRGILQSIASRNDHDLAMGQLGRFGLADYFLHPQINWSSKAASIGALARRINIAAEAIAFVDDQPFERDEVRHSLPEVLCLDAAELGGLLEREELRPRFVTEDAARRRQMYLSDNERQRAEDAFTGPKEAFLATLDMVLTIAPASARDLRRAEELTLRTHQLNTTGYTYSYEELDRFRRSEDHLLLIAGLDDRYGAYGKIGLALVERGGEVWTIRLLLMSCRVMSRGVGGVMISHIRNLARQAGVRLRAELRLNDRNRMMYMAYKFAHFKETEKRGELLILENDLDRAQGFPDYLTVKIG